MRLKASLWILVSVLASTPIASMGSDSTNVVDILHKFMQDLDQREKGVTTPSPREAEPTSVPAAMPSALSQPETARAVEGLPADYRLRPGDRLKVEVLGEEAMSTATAVLADNGTLALPIAGPVSVAGKTLEEATRTVREFLGADYLVDPQVKLTLLQKAQTTTPSPPGTPLTRTADEIWPGVRPPPQVIAVDSPQPQASPTPTATRATPSKICQFSIFNQVRKPGRYQWNCDEKMTLLRAIGMAGGATARADLSRVSIRRMIDGRRVASEHDLQALALDPNALPPLLQSGDEVEVPRE